ncbi:MAG: DNA cytosine methyltransferase [Rhodobacteraceae bacterium]|nr:DNA cytosine methyltransferase [Paracoccaceae bacterium]
MTGVRDHDVTKLTGDIMARDGITVDVITGGFPCQDISTAGKQAGIGEGTRSGLWSEIVRLIGELSPRYVIVENVANLLSGPSDRRGGWFGRVLGDLAECGYDAEWESLPAGAVGAPHERDRVWILAYPGEVREFPKKIWNMDWSLLYKTEWKKKSDASGGRFGWAPEPNISRVANGIPFIVDRRSSCGNAVIPQIPEMIGQAILKAESASYRMEA